jgi:hypothetical protein
MIDEVISRCRIVEKHDGSMGVVYKVEGTRLHRFVALKFLVDSVSLKQRIAGCPVETEAILSLAIEIADTPDAAPDKGSYTVTSSPPIFSLPRATCQDSRLRFGKSHAHQATPT